MGIFFDAEFVVALKRRAVKEFVASNGRSPTIPELRELAKQAKASHPGIEQVGFVGFDLTKPQYKQQSSARAENKNRQAMADDLTCVSNQLATLADELEDGFRGFTSTAQRSSKMLRAIESRLDNLLLLNQFVDVFVYGTEETFSTQDKVDFLNSTASVESGFVTMGRSGYTPIDLNNIQFSSSVITSRGFLSINKSSEVDRLMFDDGSFWETLVYTGYRQGRVSLVLEVELGVPDYISDVRLTGRPVNSNNLSTVTVFYSLDGQTFSVAGGPEQSFRSGENQYAVGKEGVKKLRILISKLAADDTTSSNGQYVYVFSLDSLRLYGDEFGGATGESVLYSGPYQVKDMDGNPYRFSKAKLDCCAVIPEGTNLNFFLSQDGTTWVPIAHDHQSLSIATFGSSDKSGTYSLLDSSIDHRLPITGTPEGIGYRYDQDCFLNLYIRDPALPTAEYPQGFSVSRYSIEVKRNLPSDYTVRGIDAGWERDPLTNQYFTTVEVAGQEGRYLGLGSTSAWINGSLVTGTVWLPPGRNSFSTTDTNWRTIDEQLTNASSLVAQDPYYPYNHKYLIEGYPYPTGFTGEQIYQGVGSMFGRALVYVPPEVFGSPQYDNDLTIYTIEDLDGNLYLKVKTNKSDASWLKERFQVDYLVAGSASENLWCKILFSTSDPSQTPTLDSFRVRVV